ncbi:hypothetical protein FALB51S_04080 [Frigidibacter albus]
MTRILSIGEAMVEMSRADQPGLWRMGIAGDTLNTAWYLRRLLGTGWQVGYLTRIGTGEFSQQLLDFLAAEGLDATHVRRETDAEIGLYAISLKNGERSFAYWRGQSAAKRLADDPAALAAALAGCGMAYLSGITLAILPPEGRQALLEALQAGASGRHHGGVRHQPAAAAVDGCRHNARRDRAGRRNGRSGAAQLR